MSRTIFSGDCILSVRVLSLSSILIIISFALLKAGVGLVVAEKEIPAVVFLFAPWEATFAYDRLEIGDEFLIAVIFSSIKFSRRADASAAFRISWKISWLVGPCLAFSIKADEAWRKLLKLSPGGLCPS